MRQMGSRRWRRVPYPAILAGPIPDLTIDFTTGRGIPVANGGAGGRGSELVTITSPQSGAGFYRRRLQAYDPTWQGYPLFELKPANELVGWAGPRAGGWWTGPMPSRSSTSETVAVYSTLTGLTVTNVAGGVVGSDAIRCDVAAGQSGNGWILSPVATLTSGWTVDAAGNHTVCYLHAVVELLGNIADYRFVFGLYDSGASAFIEQITQRYDAADASRSGKVYRGIGPHGGHLYEVWALARLISTPVGPLQALAYLLSSGSGSNPARTVIVHGAQTYFLTTFQNIALAGLPPFFSYARGSSVAWTTEDFQIADVTGAYTIGLNVRAIQFETGAGNAFARIVSRNGHDAEIAFHRSANTWRVFSPTIEFLNFNGRVIMRVDGSYNVSVTVNGTSVTVGGTYTSPAPSPSFLRIGYALTNAVFYGRLRRLFLWCRALTDAEMLTAFNALGEPVP